MWDAIDTPQPRYRHTTDTPQLPMFHVKHSLQSYPQPVHKSFHIVRYPLKRGITILDGIGRVEGKNAVQAVLVRFRGHANKF